MKPEHRIDLNFFAHDFPIDGFQTQSTKNEFSENSESTNILLKENDLKIK